MEVSTRELKNHLSRYLRLVASGETVIITSRRKVLAKVSAVPSVDDSGIQSLIEAGNATWSGKKPQVDTRTFRPGPGGKPAADMVLEDRG